MTISILAEIPDELHESLQSYLDEHPSWDQDKAFTAALSLFLIQNKNDTNAARVYLDTQFGEAA